MNKNEQVAVITPTTPRNSNQIPKKSILSMQPLKAQNMTVQKMSGLSLSHKKTEILYRFYSIEKNPPKNRIKILRDSHPTLGSFQKCQHGQRGPVHHTVMAHSHLFPIMAQRGVYCILSDLIPPRFIFYSLTLKQALSPAANSYNLLNC